LRDNATFAAASLDGEEEAAKALDPEHWLNSHLHIVSFDVPWPANYGGVSMCTTR
jgi:hypothetical protein